MRILQLLGCSLGLFFLFWACFGTQFRDAKGFLEGSFCVPLSVGIALVVLVCAMNTSLNRFAFWFALALVGQATALQIIEAGRLLHYQHYRPFASERIPLLLTCLSLQLAFVVGGFRARWPEMRQWIGRNFKFWKVLGISSLFVLFSAAPSRDSSAFVLELLFAAFVQTVNLGTIILAAWALPEKVLNLLRMRFEKFLGPSRDEPKEGTRIHRFAYAAALWVTVLAATLNFFSYDHHPHVEDEVIYLYQARYFANGMLTTPAPAIPEAFNVYMIPYRESRWYSPFPPGWPAVLAIGVLFGVPWLVNPVLGGLNILLSYLIIRQLYSLRVARLAVLLLCFSPWYIFMSMNYMAHTSTLTCFLAAVLAVSWARKTSRIMWAVVGGCAVGMTSLIRPLDGLATALLLGIWVLGLGAQRLKISSIIAFALGTIMVGSLTLFYNYLLMDDPFVFPLTAYYEEYFGPNVNALGFGSDRGLGWPIDAFPGHSPFEALINLSINTFLVNIELFGWSTGSLIVILVLLFSGKMKRKDHLLLAVLLVTIGLYSLYWFNGGPDFGARYWYLTVIPLVVLTVRGIHHLERSLKFGSASLSDSSPRVTAAVLSLCLTSFLTFFVWRATDKYHLYLGMRSDIRLLAQEYDFGKSLVLIQGESYPDYLSAWTYNTFNFRDDNPLYGWDRSSEIRARLLAAYSDRPVWFVNGPALTGGSYQVVRGPVTPYKRLNTSLLDQ